MAGKVLGYMKEGILIPITRLLAEDNQAYADRELPNGGDGYINIGSDLVIWTKHLTKYVVYTRSTGNTTPIAQPVHYSLTVAVQGEGIVTPTPRTYSYLPGEIVRFGAQPAEGWEFVHWLINGEEVTDPLHSLMVLKKTAATAVFAEIKSPDPDPDDPAERLLITVVGRRGYTFEGKWVDMVPCYYKGNDTMMPVRMLEAFGVELDWDQATLTAELTYNGNTTKQTIGSTYACINGVKTPIVGASGALVAPELAPGRTMIPLRFVSEYLGFKVTWDPSNLITVSLDDV
jgi:hypothetical protein